MKNNNYKKKTVSRLRMWLIALLLIGGFSLIGNAQVNTYTFSQSVGTYTPVLSGTTVASGAGFFDDNNFATVPIGFNFTYKSTNNNICNTFTTVGISANGFIRLGALTTTSYTAISAAQTNVIAALNRDLLGNQASSYIRTSTTGSAGSQVFTVEWANWGNYSAGTAAYNFEIKLYETSGVIEMRYGAMTPPLTTTCQVGLRGTGTATDFATRVATTAGWASSSAGTVSSTSSLSATIAPANGTIFTYTPSVCAVPCTGTPAIPVASAPATACSGTSFALSSTGATIGLGITYQWQVSTNGGATWTNVLGATSDNSTASQTVASTYQLITTCTFSGLTSTSNVVSVGMSNYLDCYCTSSATSTFDEDISNVTFGTLNNSSGCATVAPGPGSVASLYSNYKSGVGAPAVPDVTRGDVVPFSVTQTTCNGNYGNKFGIYIDYNHNGLFTDAGENVFTGPYLTGNHTDVGTITIPVTAAIGQTAMRVVVVESSVVNPCGTYSWGETEDYLINILPIIPCVDPPTAGQALASISSFCETASPAVNLSLTGNSYGSGQTYQWQYSFDDLTYINIGPVSTTSPYTTNPTTTTYYRCLVTCGLSSIESGSVLVTAVPSPVGGVATGPTTLTVGGAAGVYDVTGQTANFIWQSSTDNVTFTNIPGTANTTPINLSANAGGTFYIRALASEAGCTSSPSNVITVVASLVNDNVCGALAVNIGNNGPYTNVGATSQAGEPAPPALGCNVQNGWCEGGVTVSVWFAFTVPANGSGRYTIQTPGWDSQLAIYSAADCNAVTSGGATLLQANDDGLVTNFASQTFSHCLNPGQTYFIQVDGYFGGTFSNIFVNIIDDGFANPSFTGLPTNACVLSSTPIALTAAVAGGTFSGPGVAGNNFTPSNAGVGTHSITYTLGGIDICYSSSQSITVDPVVATYYADADGDTYGNPSSSISSCSFTPPAGYVVDNTDCDDASPAVNPAATEVCNLIDDNCNGSIDEGYDVDGDGYFTCTGDCNDNNAAINPAAAEVCNGIDDNCNGLNDDGLTFITYYADADGDTYGDPNVSQSTCDGAPAGYVLDNTDCNDAVATANPAGLELCNGIDDDCDGLTDEFTQPNAGAISGPNSQCVAATAGSSFFSIAPVPYATSYSWSVPAGMSIVSGQGTTSVFVSWTTLAVQNGINGPLTVTASNACGSGAPSSVAIDINYTAPVTPPSISGASRVCPGDVASLYSVSNVARATSYTWSVPAGMNLLSGQGSNVASISASAGYTGGVMTITANNSCGSSPVRIKNMGLNTPGVPAAISGAASGVCGLTGVVYSTAGTPAATSYAWSVPAGATIVSGQGSTSISVDFSGGFTGGPITVTGSNLCGNGAARSLSVAGAPGQPGVISGPTAICPSQAGVVYQVNTVSGADTYTWTVPGGAVITSGQGTKIITVTYGPAPATGQLVSVKASNPCGTSSSRILSGITVAFTNCVRIGSGSSNTTMDVYPNPATDRINVSFTAAVAANYTLKMQDLAGRIVYAEQGAAIEGNNMKEISLDQLAGGIYMVVLESNGVTQQVRLVVE